MLREVKHLWGICGDEYGFGSHSRIPWEFPKCHVVVHALCLWMTPLSIDDLPECLAFGSRTTLMDELEMNNFCYPSLFIFLHFQSHLLILSNLIIWKEHLLHALKNMLKDVRKWKKKSSCWSMHLVLFKVLHVACSMTFWKTQYIRRLQMLNQFVANNLKSIRI